MEKPDEEDEIMVKGFNEEAVRAALDKAWSLETAKQWSKENPANGQCNVTAAVIQGLFGGEIWRTRYPTFWHYYNAFDGKRVDLTDTQFTRPNARFTAPEASDDEVSTREAAMDGIPQREFDALKAALAEQLEG